jgi:hypothetical protein
LHGQPVGPVEIEQDDLAPMPQKELELGKPFKHAGERDPEELHAGLVVTTCSVTKCSSVPIVFISMLLSVPWFLLWLGEICRPTDGQTESVTR